MKSYVVHGFLCFLTLAVQAQEVGQVISRTPVYQQVSVPRQSCTQSQPTVAAQSTGGGALLGAVVGGLIGSQLGGRDNKGMAAMAGVIGGAVMGDRVENQGNPAAPQTTCTTVNVYENRLTGYNVVYEYAGKQYNVQLPQDPGPTISLQVTPVLSPRSDVAPEPVPAPAVVFAPAPTTVITETRVVYANPPVYRSYSPVSTHIQWGWGVDARRHPGHSHWR